MKKFLIFFFLLLLALSSQAITADISFSFQTTEVLIGLDSLIHGWPFTGERHFTGFQVITSDFSREYLIDIRNQKAFVFTENFFSRDFWIYKSPTNQVKSFSVETDCRLKILKVHEVGGFEIEAFSVNTVSSFILIDDDEIYFSLQPFEEKLCKGKISDGAQTLEFEIDFALVESSEDFVRKFVFDCYAGEECFRTSDGEEVNVTEWESKGCSFENIRKGNFACQSQYTQLLEDQKRSLESDLNEAQLQSSPELKKEIEKVNSSLNTLKKSVIYYAFWFLVGILILVILILIAMWYRSWARSDEVQVVKPPPKIKFETNALIKEYGRERVSSWLKTFDKKMPLAWKKIESVKDWVKNKSEWKKIESVKEWSDGIDS